MSSNEIPRIDDPKSLSDWLSQPSHEGRHVRTQLNTNARVIARVTDGIYRLPGSALRELISNAWDADATTVTILTDAPRFSKIYVRDDGAGMSYKTLSRLLHNIGGSAKRREEGQVLGVTSEDDPDKTPCGRQLIGKIGIGLFSVSQLSRRFRIITKVRGENYRLIAEVRLRAYSEDDDDAAEADDSFHNGEVIILREHSDDADAHGTDIILDEIKPRVRDLLRDADRWKRIEEREQALADGDLDTYINIRTEEPLIHSGWLGELGTGDTKADTFRRPPQLPWTAADPASVRMSMLMDKVEQATTRTNRPDLAETLDAYLDMLWKLALASPVPYVDKHPFDLTAADNIKLFWLSNASKGQASEVEMDGDETVREAVERRVSGNPILHSGAVDPAGGFKVIVDGVELRRPIRFKFLQPDIRSIEQALLFVGKYEPGLAAVPSAIRGGFLAVEGYLYWNGRIIPKDNNGVLVRIRGAGSGLFDPTFFQYQVSEQTRLRQITSEIFVQKGLDAALNIDRESFNFSHPHVQLVTSWLHRSLRQLTNRHKDLSSRKRLERFQIERNENLSALEEYTNAVWQERRGYDLPPDIRFEADAQRALQLRQDGIVSYVRNEIGGLSDGYGTSAERDAQARAVASVLSAFGVMDGRSFDEQQKLISALLLVFTRFR
ncbi:ATP-binding protein [Aureimonas ureilytica]|uniref:ATP-binding protein n=1 Tax=Aureimonas ureilytica TaxID=401562 RepID=UPI003CE7EBAB